MSIFEFCQRKLAASVLRGFETSYVWSCGVMCVLSYVCFHVPVGYGTYAAIGLFVFALDSTKLFGALDACSTSGTCMIFI